jgi:hypothetical protein
VATTDDSGAALDANSHDIADLLSQAQHYGESFGSGFYTLWTNRITDFAAYATAKAAKDTTGAQAAVSALSANATDIATLFHQTNPYIAVTSVTSTGLADELGENNGLVTAFIDTQAAKETTALADVVLAVEGTGAAAPGMRHTATVLAAAAAQLDSDQYPGHATGTAANLRASVTSALTEHVQLAGLSVDQLVKGVVGGPESSALDGNTLQLANIVTANFGDPPARQFTTLWSAYVTALEATAHAKTGSGTAPDLSGVGAGIGAFFGQLAPQFSASTIGADMQRMVNELSAYIDAAASGRQPVTQLRVAAATVPKLGSDLAEGIAEYGNTVKLGQYLP